MGQFPTVILRYWLDHLFDVPDESTYAYFLISFVEFADGEEEVVDFFVGEIFQGSYPEVYDMVREFIDECGGRLVVFRNHSKVMAIQGERFDCLIESSANVNTNPRSENTVVTVDRELTKEYIKLFSEIVPFNKDAGAEPYWKED